MIDGITPNEVFKLADVVEYAAGKLERRILAENDGMRLAVMAFDSGAALPEHAAPGEVVVFVLEGTALITSNGADYAVRAGENFMFAQGEMHAVRADAPMKMAIVAKLA